MEIAIGGFALLVPFDFIVIGGESGGGSATTLNWYVGAAAGLVLLATALVQRRLTRPPQAALWWGLLIMWAAATPLWALDPQRALQRLPTAVALFLLYLAAVSVKMTKKELSRIVFFVIMGGIAAVFLEFLLGNHDFAVERATLVVGSMVVNPNDFAAPLLLPLSLAIGGFLAAQKFVGRLAWLAVLSTLTLSVFLTMSRGALVALAILMLVYLLRWPGSVRVFMVIALLFVAVVILSPAYVARIEDSVASRGQGRFDLWQVGFAALRHYGFFGAGLDNFPAAYDKFASAATFFRGFQRAAHNVFLGTAVELGLVGFGLFVAGIQSQLRAALKMKNPAKKLSYFSTVPYEAGCWGMLAMGLSLDNLWLKAYWCAWILLALAVQVRESTIQSELAPIQ